MLKLKKGVIIMKKAIRIFCVLSLVTLALVGCSSSNESDTKRVAKEFTSGIYNVDEAKVTAYNAPMPEITGDVSQEYNYEAVRERLKEIDKSILPLITKEGYEVIIYNQHNTATAMICSRDNYTAQVTDITLGENVYKDYKDNDKVRYRYEVKLDFISSDGKTKQADTSKGAVELVKEDGKWKVCSFGINQMPKLYK
ncbi:MAG: hypothetical protein ACJAX4_003601 [Clostridium sp.]